MSKKNKKLNKKLKQLLRQQILTNEQKFSQTSQNQTAKVTVSKIQKQETQTKEVSSDNSSLTKNINPFFKYDLIKIGLTLGIIIILFGALVIFSNSSNYLDQVSQKLASFIHL